jgi:hypothetical protein
MALDVDVDVDAIEERTSGESVPASRWPTVEES